MSKEQLKTLSDEDILAAAEQIIADEQAAIAKSMEMPAAEAAAPEMSDEEMKKKELEKGCEDMGMDVKKSQADIEGKETGGLAPSVQGNLPGPQGSQGGSEDEANKAIILNQSKLLKKLDLLQKKPNLVILKTKQTKAKIKSTL